MSGWYVMHRDWQSNPVFGSDEFSRRDAWIWMIEQACWKPTKFSSNGKIITLTVGQFGSSVRQMADAWKWSKSSVDRFLTRLKTDTMIETESGTGRMVVTICNYAKYQRQEDEAGTQTGTQTGTRAGHERDTKEQGNKGTIEEEGSNEPPSTRNAREKFAPAIPDWVPQDPWAGWLEMRRKKSAYPTPRAIELAIRKLEKLKAAGNDPGDVLDQSTLNQWTDLYPIKEQRNGTGSKPRSTQPPRNGGDEIHSPWLKAIASRSPRDPVGETADGGGFFDAPGFG